MKTKRRNTQTAGSLRCTRIAGAVVVAVMIAAAGGAEAKGGGKGGGGKDGNFAQYLDDLAKFDTSPPQYMKWGRGRHDDTLARPGLATERPDPVRVDCYTKVKYYDWITGTDVITYSGRQRNC